MQDCGTVWSEVQCAIDETRARIDTVIPEVDRPCWHLCLDELLSAAFEIGPVLPADAWILPMVVEAN